MEVLYYQIFIFSTIALTGAFHNDSLKIVCGFWTAFTIINLFYPPLIIIQLANVWIAYFLFIKPKQNKPTLSRLIEDFEKENSLHHSPKAKQIPQKKEISFTRNQSLWHVTHWENVNQILKHGILSQQILKENRKNYFEIFPIKDSRRKKNLTVKDHSLDNYVSAYLSPTNIKFMSLGPIRKSACLLELESDITSTRGTWITDGDSFDRKSRFYPEESGLTNIEWNIIRSSKLPDSKEDRRRQCAEVLIPNKISPSHIKRIYCLSLKVSNRIQPTQVPVVFTDIQSFESAGLAESGQKSEREQAKSLKNVDEIKLSCEARESRKETREAIKKKVHEKFQESQEIQERIELQEIQEIERNQRKKEIQEVITEIEENEKIDNGRQFVCGKDVESFFLKNPGDWPALENQIIKHTDHFGDGTILSVREWHWGKPLFDIQFEDDPDVTTMSLVGHFDYVSEISVPKDLFANIENSKITKMKLAAEPIKKRSEPHIEILSNSRKLNHIQSPHKENRKQDIYKSSANRFENDITIFSRTSLWHITHWENLYTIIELGLQSRTNIERKKNLLNHDISLADVQTSRRFKLVRGRNLHDYVPLYFNPRNPMLYLRKDMQEDLCIIEFPQSLLTLNGAMISDGNAASDVTNFYNGHSGGKNLPWDVLKSNYWSDFEDGKRKRCAEALVPNFIYPSHIVAVHCYNDKIRKRIKPTHIPLLITKELFF